MTMLESMVTRTNTREEFIQKWRSLLIVILMNAATVGIVMGAVWLLFSGASLEAVKRTLGMDEVTETIAINHEEVMANIGELKKATTENANAIDKFDAYLMSLDRVALYDTRRSSVVYPCNCGEPCTAVFWTKRNPQWTHCAAPKVVGYFVDDRYGTTHDVNPTQTNRAQKQGTVRKPVPLGFIASCSIPSGFSEFYLRLQYECDSVILEEESYKIPFILEAAKGSTK